ncbi:MAG TPA: O-antigen ligase family protein [Blastocatellia bacterium]|nr:O-antigen ligase family protein [Blastocatellia bacterium]
MNQLPVAASPRRRAAVSLLSVEGLLIFWFVASPVASFYLRFPVDKSLVTFNRGVIALAIGLLIFGAFAGRRLDFTATKFEIAWAMVAAIALVNTVFLSNDFTYGLKLAVDSFALPLVMFHLARYHFDARGRGPWLWLAAAALAWCLFLTGAYEFLRGVNLFQYKGSELIREGERRVNGPFAADGSYAIICLLVFVFLQAAPHLFRVKRDRAARFFATGALLAAAAAALLPMFRSAAIALVICWLIVRFATVRREALTRRRVAASLIALLLLVGVTGAALGLLASGKRLTNPRNLIGRLATWESAIAITLDSPVVGVGLANYQWAFDQHYFYSDAEAEELLDTAAADSPHSNLLWVAAEMGVVALLLYVVANAYLLLIGWRALRRAQSVRARAAAAGMIALFVAYWLSGLTLASGYYSDANLYFFFLMGLLSNPTLTADARA